MVTLIVARDFSIGGPKDLRHSALLCRGSFFVPSDLYPVGNGSFLLTRTLLFSFADADSAEDEDAFDCEARAGKTSEDKAQKES